MTNVTVLVSTWDGWSNLWEPFAWAWQHHWPGCPWPVKWITNRKVAPMGETIQTGDSVNWSTMTRKALEAVDSDVVLFIHEDCWLVHPVNGPALLDFADVVLRNNADHVRLQRAPQATQGGAGTYGPDPRLYVLDTSFPYYLCLQASFWRRDVFLSLLRPGEHCWHFETNGSDRGRRAGVRALCIDAATNPPEWDDMSHLCYINAACRGKWRLKWENGDWVQGGDVTTTPVPAELWAMIGKESDGST